MPSPTAFDALPVHRFRAHLRPERDLRLPPTRHRALLRGAFAMTLRTLVCHDMSLACASCPLRSSCAYPAVFDPGAALGPAPIARLSDPPRPFVVRETSAWPSVVAAGDRLSMDLHVVGQAQAHASYLLAAVDRLARDGLGPDRVRLTLERVEAIDARGLPSAVALDPTKAAMCPEAPPIRASDLARPGDRTAHLARVRFLTPTLLRDGGATVREPAFAPLVRRLRARVGALATLFGGGPLADDPRACGEAAESVALRAADVHWSRELRRSTRTGQYHPIEGLVGEAVYEGDLGGLMPLLRLGELLHAGKHASFGLGRVEVEVIV